MSQSTFNPNEIGRPTGNYFALPYTLDEAEIVIISVPWDVTTSYKPGTAAGPQAIIDASAQVDLFDFEVSNAWDIRIANVDLDLKQLNTTNRALAEQVIAHLEDGGAVDDEAIRGLLDQVNRASENVNEQIYAQAKKALQEGRVAAVVGGEHSVPFGLIKAVAEQYPGVGVLHIDAHADLRDAYEGFHYSHASIMHNVMHRIDQVGKLVQVGIRDLCQDEVLLATRSKRIVMFPDEVLKQREFNGATWHQQCEEIVDQLPSQVHISFDIDGLCPSLCPHTGTPVPGGLSFSQAIYLIREVVSSGRTIVGFDLCETAPGLDDWDANVGARTLFKLCCYTYLSVNKKT